MASSHSSEPPVIVLFRHDLRLGDNRALTAASRSGKPIVACFVLDEESKGMRALGGARRWWLHHSLEQLSDALEKKDVRLVLRRGAMAPTVAKLAEETGSDLVLWNRRYEPAARTADEAMRDRLQKADVHWEDFDGQLLHEPDALQTSSGGYYKVYTPFWRALTDAIEPRDPLPAPKTLDGFRKKVKSEKLADWKLLPTGPDWAGGLRDTWTPGEKGAHAKLGHFLDSAASGYERGRDMPGEEATSRLSPHLCHGEITPFQIWHATKSARSSGIATFHKEVVWREFCWHLLFHNRDLHRDNFNSDFDRFPWRTDKKALKAWQAGRTGYPIVDAGMRQLWQTGWMHNRIRMVTASFLVKHLLLDWRKGEEWFWDTLVDADAANNPANWQWVAGSGADASPYFRIFNPILQGEKFDRNGAYVETFVPEIACLKKKTIHKPWEAQQDGFDLGKTYPSPIIDHREGRERALAAYKSTRNSE